MHEHDHLGDLLADMDLDDITRLRDEAQTRRTAQQHQQDQARATFAEDTAGTMRYDQQHHIIFVRTIEGPEADGLTYHGWDTYIRDNHGIHVEDTSINPDWPILGVLPPD